MNTNEKENDDDLLAELFLQENDPDYFVEIDEHEDVYDHVLPGVNKDYFVVDADDFADTYGYQNTDSGSDGEYWWQENERFSIDYV